MHRLFTLTSGIGACPDEDDDSRLRRMVFIWASLAGVPSLVIYCAVFTFLGAPLAAVIMFAYLTIVLIDLIAFSMTGRGFSRFLLFLTLSPRIVSLLLVIIFGGLMASAMHVVWGLLIRQPRSWSMDRKQRDATLSPTSVCLDRHIPIVRHH